ncbi:MAG: hypothetical protein ACC628_01155 [Pirellulaceae bacterium]
MKLFVFVILLLAIGACTSAGLKAYERKAWQQIEANQASVEAFVN